MLYVKAEIIKEFKEGDATRIAHFIQEMGELSDKYSCNSESWEIKEID